MILWSLASPSCNGHEFDMLFKNDKIPVMQCLLFLLELIQQLLIYFLSLFSLFALGVIAYLVASKSLPMANNLEIAVRLRLSYCALPFNTCGYSHN